jgi:hypothetical protein
MSGSANTAKILILSVCVCAAYLPGLAILQFIDSERVYEASAANANHSQR